MMNDFIQAFKEEAEELLADLEGSLLELEGNSADKGLVGRAFRAMHTIKGCAAMAGMDNVSNFTHGAETVLDAVRGNRLQVTKELVDLTLSACDVIKSMVYDTEPDPERVRQISDSLNGLLSMSKTERSGERKEVAAVEIQADASSVESGAAKEPEAESREEMGPDVTYRIRFQPEPSVLLEGIEPMLLLDELRALGECTVVARTGGVPPLAELAPEFCNLYWDIIVTTKSGLNSIKDVFIFLEGRCDLKIDHIDDEISGTEDDGQYKKFGEILVDRGDASAEDIENALGSQKRVGQILSESGAVSEDAVDSAAAEQRHVRDQRAGWKEAAKASNIRVPSERLDGLVNLAGELVTVQARLSRKAAFIRDAELQSIAEVVERLSAELRDNIMNIRMLPIGSTFAKFNRLIRDLSKELGKKINLMTEGGETELDKTVIERLSDPLVHILRNSIDHGIEMPDEREAAGKPRTGVIRLAAVHRGAEVIISVEDDGAGIDPVAVRDRALEKGLIAPDAKLSENEICELLFVPGFSTAKKVTDVSGRGVGMDVVKRSIEALRGSVTLESNKGAGSRISLKLPLTLAIIDGLLVRIGEELFILPLLAVEECVELGRHEVERAWKLEMMDLRGEIVPYLRLREIFEIGGEPPLVERVVIVETRDGARVGLGVDQVVGQHQTVIKSLGELYKNAQGISGATILGDGTVALILDVQMLIQAAEKAGQPQLRN